MKIEGTEQLLRNLSKYEKEKIEAIYQAAAGVQAMVVNSARSACPVHTTTLLKSIMAGVVEIKMNEVTAEVKAESEYASWVELGTRPHFPPTQALEQWAEDKLGDARLAFVVARAISRRGTPPRPFLGPALMSHQSTFRSAIARAMR